MDTIQNVKQDAITVSNIPSSSPFSKIKIGMSMNQVNQLIGMPSNKSSYPTINTFIPFYFGSDRIRTKYYYEGEGEIIFKDGDGLGFGGNKKVYSITYSPDKNG